MAIMTMGKRTGRADTNSLTAPPTKVNLLIIKSKEKVNTPGLMEPSISGSGRTTKWTEKGNKSGTMAEFMKGSLKTIKSMGRVSLLSRIRVNTKENGRMESSTGKESLQIMKMKC
jgi:hypothetical protein